MKITKSQLKQIIKEEIVNEIGRPISQIGGGVPVADPHTAAIDSLEDYIANHYSQDDALRELVENVQDMVLDFEDKIKEESGSAIDTDQGLTYYGLVDVPYEGSHIISGDSVEAVKEDFEEYYSSGMSLDAIFTANIIKGRLS